MSEIIRGKLSDAGRVVLPVELRRAFHLEGGEEIIFTRSEFGIQITPLKEAIRQAQELVGRYIPKDVDLVGELQQARKQDRTFD